MVVALVLCGGVAPRQSQTAAESSQLESGHPVQREVRYKIHVNDTIICWCMQAGVFTRVTLPPLGAGALYRGSAVGLAAVGCCSRLLL